MSKLLKVYSYQYHYSVDGIPVCVIVMLMVELCANPPNDIQNSTLLATLTIDEFYCW